MMARKRRNVLLLVETYAGYGRAILEGIIQYVRQYEHWQMLHHLGPAVDPKLVELHPHADGYILAGSADIADAVQATGKPAVLVSGRLTRPDMPVVVADNVAVGRMAFEYFLSRGFTRFAYCGFDATWFSDVRGKAFIDAAKAAGHETAVFHADHTFDQRWDWQVGVGQIRAWIEQLPKPLAMFAANVVRAEHVAIACREADVHVPEQVSILGVDDDELACNLVYPPLSSIDHGTRRIGFEAATMLDALMDGKSLTETHVTVPPVGVVQRQSTDTLAIDHPQVLRALRYIREHAREGINVQDVLRQVPMSRRALELAFKKCLNRTMHGEITRLRIEAVKTLLRQTDLPLPDIAAATGFNFASQLSNTFKRQTGHSPSKFRADSRLPEARSVM